MYVLLLLPLSFLLADALPFLGFSPLKDCPNISPQENIQIDQVTGSWRLAYLFYEDQEEFEEDGACLVADISQSIPSQFSITVYMDWKEDEFTVERSSFDLIAMFDYPGEWMLQSSLAENGLLHIRVISLTKRHMILTFCITNETNSDNEFKNDRDDSNFLQRFRRERNNLTPFIKSTPELTGGIADISEIFASASHKRGKRNIDADGIFTKKRTSNKKNEKHFWTVILAKDNNVSALNYVENATVLMKFGYDIRKGNLISFGKCGV